MGHEPCEDGPKLFAGRTDLDTGAFYTGRLVVGVFDDGVSGGPIDLIENFI
jgi:serine/threonine protein phosphatase 1